MAVYCFQLHMPKDTNSNMFQLTLFQQLFINAEGDALQARDGLH